MIQGPGLHGAPGTNRFRRSTDVDRVEGRTGTALKIDGRRASIPFGFSVIPQLDSVVGM